jgi:hypothetical protein
MAGKRRRWLTVASSGASLCRDRGKRTCNICCQGVDQKSKKLLPWTISPPKCATAATTHVSPQRRWRRRPRLRVTTQPGPGFCANGSGASFGWNAHDFNPRSHQGTDGRVGFRRIGNQQSDC